MHLAAPYDERAAAQVVGTRVLARHRVEKALPIMTSNVLPRLATLAEGGNHPSLQPLLTGGAALGILLLLLFLTTRFNKDR